MEPIHDDKLKQDCIPVGCVLPTCRLYLPACCAPGGYLGGTWPRGCTWPGEGGTGSWGCVPGPWGVPGPGVMYLLQGGVPGLGSVPGPGGWGGTWSEGCTWSRGVECTWSGGCTWSGRCAWSWGVYLVRGCTWSGGCTWSKGGWCT